jgi:predicted negative regulator of RcsB-dependent stress response
MIALQWRGALVLCAALLAPPPAPRDIRGVDALARVYDFILEARFDQVDAELRRACGPAPPEACDVLGATALWWRILLDPSSQALDREFSVAVEKAIRSAEAWTVRAPDDAQPWFYLGGAYAARVQWHVLRNEKLAAARDAKHIKSALEHAVALDPNLDDAYFGIGLYQYYADVAPAAAKFLRFFLLLPGGDRKEGLEQMLRARNRGKLLQGEADYQLHVIYLWYEGKTSRALQLLEGLHERYPANPIFMARIAEIQDEYEHDVTASLATWRGLLAAAREQRANAPLLSEVQARLGMARQLEALFQTDDAVEMLQRVVAMKPVAPFGSLSLAHLRLGEAYDRIGSRAAAVTSYRAALASAPSPDVHSVREQASERLRRTPNVTRAEAYRLSLHGWRRLESNDLAGATAALERSLTLNGGDPVAHYRLGRVLQARKQDAAALAHFEQTIRAARTCPAPILGNAYLEAARVYERSGRSDDAIRYYRTITSLFGAASDTRVAAGRALARVQAR